MKGHALRKDLSTMTPSVSYSVTRDRHLVAGNRTGHIQSASRYVADDRSPGCIAIMQTPPRVPVKSMRSKGDAVGRPLRCASPLC